MTKVTIEYQGIQATCEDSQLWESQVAHLAKLLNTVASLDEAGRAYGYIPDRAMCRADLAIKKLPGAKIIEVKDRDEYVEGMVY